jgi:hypothetical protein
VEVLEPEPASVQYGPEEGSVPVTHASETHLINETEGFVEPLTAIPGKVIKRIFLHPKATKPVDGIGSQMVIS